MFTCKKCGLSKPPSDFYKHKAMASGYLSFCKPCVKLRVLNHREANLDRIQEYDRSRWLLPHRKEAAARHQPIHRAENPEKNKARADVNRAVSEGKIIKPFKCEACLASFPSRKIHAHHDNYSKPLDIRWLCSTCHGRHHFAVNEWLRAPVVFSEAA